MRKLKTAHRHAVIDLDAIKKALNLKGRIVNAKIDSNNRLILDQVILEA